MSEECKCLTKHGNHDFDWDLSQACRECGIKEVDFYEKELEKLRKGNEILGKMGEFYGDCNSWDYSVGDIDGSVIQDDDTETYQIGEQKSAPLGGKRARQALKEYAELMGDLK